MARWPEGDTSKRLIALVQARNDLAHRGQMTPAARQQAGAGIAEASAAVLRTLDWLRATSLVMLLDAAPAGDAHVGRRQRFRGLETFPTHETLRWRGPAKIGHLYLDTPNGLLDVEPFLDHAKLRDAPTETVLVWSGLGKHGDVRISDDLQAKITHRRMPEPGSRLVPFTWLGRITRSGDATVPVASRPDTEARSEPKASLRRRAPRAAERPTRADARRRRRRLRWLVPIALLAVLGIAAAAFFLARRASDPTIGPVETGTEPAPPKCAGAPPIGGTWRFDTEVLGWKPGFNYGRGVRGHYTMTLRAPRGCLVAGRLDKSGYTQNGKLEDDARAAEVSAQVSASGESVALSARLERTPGDAATADIAMRLAMHCDRLVGLWRHEGADRERAGYWGVLIGARTNSRDPSSPRTDCLRDCIQRCHGDSDPMSDGTEHCLLSCAPRLDDCG